ncbi:winged helix-turn-helix transcriptional regulator, partial [Rhodopseudomonas palustris]|nr:winged helix-turn-helix transcriptional regulator [Rhodopseudomonas palustris]
LTVVNIKNGNSNIRTLHPCLLCCQGNVAISWPRFWNYTSQHEWPEIDFIDDREGCLFKAIVHRKEVDGTVLPTVPGKTSGKTSGKILEAILQNNTITIPELAILIGITERSIERNLQKLQKEGTLKRIGPAKGGHWQVF